MRSAKAQRLPFWAKKIVAMQKICKGQLPQSRTKVLEYMVRVRNDDDDDDDDFQVKYFKYFFT